MVAPPPPPGTSTHRPGAPAPRPRLLAARRAPFWTLLGAGLLAGCCVPVVALAFGDRWRDADGILPDGLVSLTVAAFFGVMIATLVAAGAVVAARQAIADAPTDDAEQYGGGRRVDLVWPDRYATRGRIGLEESPDARVTATRATTGGRILPAGITVAGGPGIRVVARERLSGTVTYEILSEGATIRLTADERRDGSVDRTLDDGRGTTLRWRQRPGARVPRLTLRDDRGTAWWVRRTSRTSLRAELPDELDPVAARALLLVVEDQLTNATRASATLSAPRAYGDIVTGGD